MIKKKRAKEFELIGPSKSTFINSFFVRGYFVRTTDGKIYLTYAKKMADVCENACKITHVYNHYENEKKYVVPADLREGERKPFWWPDRQLWKPIWWYGRVYEVDLTEEDIKPMLDLCGQPLYTK